MLKCVANYNANAAWLSGACVWWRFCVLFVICQKSVYKPFTEFPSLSSFFESPSSQRSRVNYSSHNFKFHNMAEYKSFIKVSNQTLKLSNIHECSFDANNNEAPAIEFRRLQHETFVTRKCGPADNVYVSLQSNRTVALNGIAFSTAIGMPKGTLSISHRFCGKDEILVKQHIEFTTKSRAPRHYLNIERLVLKANTVYRIKVNLENDVHHYACGSIAKHHHSNTDAGNFSVYAGAASDHDIFSHFFFGAIY